jgi:hypothetical protein
LYCSLCAGCDRTDAAAAAAAADNRVVIYHEHKGMVAAVAIRSTHSDC